MSEKRFTMKGSTILENGEEMTAWDCYDLLNEQQATIQELEEDKAIAEDYANIFEKENVKLRQEIKELKAQLREKEEDEQLYANEILELREANKEFIQFKELGGDY